MTHTKAKNKSHEAHKLQSNRVTFIATQIGTGEWSAYEKKYRKWLRLRNAHL